VVVEVVVIVVVVVVVVVVDVVLYFKGFLPSYRWNCYVEVPSPASSISSPGKRSF